MLVLDVEFLLGVYFGTHDPTDDKSDWPPQVDRLFSALVATWATRGEQGDEKAALQWFETLPPPQIHASASFARTAPPVFVPPNDSGSSRIHVLPARRRRQQRRFPAAIPQRPIASYCWPDADPQAGILESLEALARDTVYVGHSSSLVRCRFHQPNVGLGDCGSQSIRRIYPGRLEELQLAFKRGDRPSAGISCRQTEASEEPAATVFGREWHVFAYAGGLCLDVRNTAVATRAFRRAIMSGFRGRPVPESLSGHTADGRPSVQTHMAIFPLANTGWKWGDGRLMGLALCLPRETSSEDEGQLFKALGEIAIKQDVAQEESFQDCEIRVALPSGDVWHVVRQPQPIGSSLKPSRYLRSSKVWATTTPIALDRHPKAAGNEARQAEIARLIADSCARIGLPRPSKVVADRHSAVRASPPAKPSPRSPEWTHWALPGALNGHVLTHVVIEFEEPVYGPVVLGAGRYFGLGLCLPLDERVRA